VPSILFPRRLGDDQRCLPCKADRRFSSKAALLLDDSAARAGPPKPLGAAFFCRLYPKWTQTCYV